MGGSLSGPGKTAMFLNRIKEYVWKIVGRYDKKFNKRLWKRNSVKEKLRKQYGLSPASVVLDVGGFRGDWADMVHREYGCKVFVFEPVAEFYSAIKQRFDDNEAIVPVHAGLGAYTRDENISLAGNASSIMASGEDSETVHIVDVKEWLDDMHVDRIDLLKANIEGGEYELIPRMIETGLISRIGTLQIQFHDHGYKYHRLMKSIRKRLFATHDPVHLYDYIWDVWKLRR